MQQLLPYILSFGAVIGAVFTYRWWVWFLRFQCHMSSRLTAQGISALVVFGGAAFCWVQGYALMISLILSLMLALHGGTIMSMSLIMRELRRCIYVASQSEDPEWQRVAQAAKPHLEKAEALRQDDGWSDAEKEARLGVKLIYDHARRQLGE